MKKFDEQYNKTAKQFNELYLDQKAHVSTNDFFACVKKYAIEKTPNDTILDLGCGAGADSSFYVSHGLKYFGVDTSSGMCEMANQNENVSEVRNESFSENISFDDKKFGLIVSKYAMQTSEKIHPIFENANRLLVDDGYFAFLVVHPLRQFLEKKKVGKDYFKQEVVESIIFDGAITVMEPTHTLQEYLSHYFFENFSLVALKEGYDFPASEQIGGDIYPTYLIVVAQKK